MAQISIDYKGCLIVVAIGLSMVAIGAIADFLVKKDEIKWIHSKLLRLSNALTKIPLREWQVKIARAGIKTIELVHRFGASCVLSSVSWVYFFVNMFDRRKRDVIFLEWFTPYSGLVYTYALITSLFVYIALPGHWLLASITFLFFGFVGGEAVDRYGSGGTLANMILAMSKAVAISAIVSTVAYMTTRSVIPPSLLNSPWYKLANGKILPTYPLLLYCFNYPFDLATISVSILLLRFVIKRKRFIGFVAAADIVISAVLTVMLYCFLLVLENGWDILHFQVYFAQSLHWFKDVIVGIYQAAKYNEPFAKHLAGLRDIHLLPILLTTFVPVALYMSVFILISFCKPVLKLASRIFGVIGEKEELVFKQFGFLIAAIMAAVKAIYEVLTL